MAKFHFRLQRVLDYRALVEGWAKDAYLEARASRLEAEDMVSKISEHRTRALTKKTDGLQARLALERLVSKLDDDEREQRIVVDQLLQDEDRSLEEWTERRKDLQALEKLREAALEEFEIEERRSEGRSLDEWAVFRRAA
jgi:flagellar export protein FliJ